MNAQDENVIQLEEQAVCNQHDSKIVKIIVNNYNKTSNEILSLEEFGKIIQWNITELTNDESERNFRKTGRYSRIQVVSPNQINL